VACELYLGSKYTKNAVAVGSPPWTRCRSLQRFTDSLAGFCGSLRTRGCERIRKETEGRKTREEKGKSRWKKEEELTPKE